MKVSRKWLQTYFEKELPSAEVLADALTFHAFEIEEHDEDMLDVKVLPDRACYALSHRGIAKEFSAILNLPMKRDPLHEPIPQWSDTNELSITVDDAYVLRHTGALVKGVKVGPSPAWLREALESIGQRSINNIVDAGNYVMNNIGQPNGVFDAGKLKRDGNTYRIDVRRAKNNEKITVLTGETYELSDSMFVFTDGVSGTLLDIAGLKGGQFSGVIESTIDVFVSVGNYDGTLIRKMAQSLKLYTDASSRYQNRPSPELTAYGMRDVLELITQVAGGELVGVLDIYPKKQTPNTVSISTATINKKLGSSFTDSEVTGVFNRLSLPYREVNGSYEITPPFERRDIVIPEDVVEEVGRIIGYDKISPVPLTSDGVLVDQAHYQGIERVKDYFIKHGFTEVTSPSFAETGDIQLANPLDKTKSWLRANLADYLDYSVMTQSLVQAARVFGLADVCIFEIGTVFTNSGEELHLAYSVASHIEKANTLGIHGEFKTERIKEHADNLKNEFGISCNVNPHVAEANLSILNLSELGRNYEPKRIALGAYKQFSVYPFALRDIAVWTPEGTNIDAVRALIEKEAGDLLVRLDVFDTFKKENRISYAFRLVLEATDRTLTEKELNDIMERVTGALNAEEGFAVR